MNDELTILRKNIGDTEKKFQDQLEKFLGNVEKIGANAVSLYAGTLYRQVEGDEIDYVKLVLCTSIMRQFLQSGDKILNEPDDADIRYFQIEYKFPRKPRKLEK